MLGSGVWVWAPQCGGQAPLGRFWLAFWVVFPLLHGLGFSPDCISVLVCCLGPPYCAASSQLGWERGMGVAPRESLPTLTPLPGAHAEPQSGGLRSAKDGPSLRVLQEGNSSCPGGPASILSTSMVLPVSPPGGEKDLSSLPLHGNLDLVQLFYVFCKPSKSL